MYFEDNQKNFFFKLQKEQDEELSQCIPWEDFDPRPTREEIEAHEKDHREKTLEKYRLKWNNQQNKADSNFEIIFYSKTFNISIICDGWEISKCHFKDSTFKGSVDFSNSVFKDLSLISSTFEDDVILRNVSFKKSPLHLFMDCTLRKALVLANNDFQEQKLLFCRTLFEGEIDLHDIKTDLIVFNEPIFKNNFNFGIMLNASSVKEVEFYDSEFEQNATFHTCYTKINKILIQNSIFKNRVFFKSSLCEITLSKSEFEKSVYFEGPFKGPNIKKLDFNGASFQNLAFFDTNFDSLPDFSKANFFKQPNIERYEKWNENKKNVANALKEENAEAKFRFLKDYFAKKNNHQKELEYFELEMIAKSKSLKGIKCFEKTLYFFYRILSSYGNSVMRPLLGLSTSFVFFGVLNFFYKSCCINKALLDRAQCAATISFAKTLLPLTTPELTSALSIFQIIINLTLLFLLFLGLRNKFKIK